MPKKILVTGCAGSVGHDLLYFISTIPTKVHVVGADINEGFGLKVVDDALHTAHNLGRYPEISFQKIDLFDVDETSGILKEIQPSVICNLASLGSWWITRLLPEEVYKKICPLGPLLPNHLTLAYKLMQAVKKSGISTKVVNGAYPDLTNVVLGKIGLPPVCGGGNMDHSCERIRRLVSKELNMPPNNVFVYGVGHHGTHYTSGLKGPFWVKILAGGKDVSEKFPLDKIRKMYELAGYSKITRLSSPLTEQVRTASTFLKNTLAIFFDTGEIQMCVQGPNGLPGGYPTRLNAKGAEVVLPDEITLEKAIRINEEGAKWDGIENVKPDGTVVYLDENVKNMSEILDYECKELKVSEVEERALELSQKINRLYQKYK